MFAHSFDSNLRSEMNASTVTLFKNFDEKVNSFSGTMDLDLLRTFVDTNSIKTIMDFDQKAAEVIFSSHRSTLFGMYNT